MQQRLSPRSPAAASFLTRACPQAMLLLLASCSLFVYYPLIAHARPQFQGPEVPTAAEQAMFTKGQTLYDQGLYSEAIVVFSELLKSYPNSLIKDLDLLWLGRSYLREGNIANAERTGLHLREIPDTPFVGMYEEELRIARQSYLKTPPPSPARRTAAVSNAGPGPAIPPAKPQNSQLSATSEKLQIPRPALTPEKSTASKAAPPDINVAANHRGNQNQAAQGPPAKTPLASNNALVRSQKQKNVLSPPPASANVSAPLLRIRIEEMPRAAAANGVVFYRLVLVNEGNGAAKDLIVREELDSSLDFASSDPAPARQEIVARILVLIFRLPSLEPGASRVIRIAVRPRPDAKAKTPTVNSATQTKHSVIYRDSKGNTYHTP